MKRQLGAYTVQAKIASGGMAEVFLATKQGAEGWQQEVVVKRILPYLADRREFRRRFLKEASIATKLSHANLVRIHDYTEVDGELCIIEEYVDGKDLQQLKQRCDGELPWPIVTHITYEILKVLQYLQAQRPAILHRDISPQNIMLTYDGQVKLLDLGIAESDNGKGFDSKA